MTDMAALTLADVLNRAADLIEPEGAWIKRVDARIGQGKKEVSPSSDLATCFCAVGAIWRATGQESYTHVASRAVRAVEKSLGLCGKSDLARWNDRRNRTQSEVVAALRQAAADAMPRD